MGGATRTTQAHLGRFTPPDEHDTVWSGGPRVLLALGSILVALALLLVDRYTLHGGGLMAGVPPTARWSLGTGLAAADAELEPGAG